MMKRNIIECKQYLISYMCKSLFTSTMEGSKTTQKAHYAAN